MACRDSAASWVNSWAGAYAAAILPRRNSTSASTAKGKVNRRGASRSCRTDNAVEHSARVDLLLNPHQRSGRFADDDTKRIDELWRFEQRLTSA